MRSIFILVIISVSAISYWLSFNTEHNVGPEQTVLLVDLVDDKGQNYSIWVDQYEVTNEDFNRFTAETGYVTTAEKSYKDSLVSIDSMLKPGSLIFNMPDSAQSNWTIASIWTWKEGANWKNPYGDTTGVDGLGDHPVVHVSAEDAEAYAKWAGKRLPSVMEWDHIAKMDSRSGKEITMNRWTGVFPYINSSEDGFVYTAPVGTYDPDPLNLFDIRGNVWEICKGEKGTYFLKGGSFLCHDSYCRGYNIENRQILHGKTSLMHTGFRCVKDHSE